MPLGMVFNGDVLRWFLSHERRHFRGIGLTPILPVRRGLAALRESAFGSFWTSNDSVSIIVEKLDILII